MASEEYSLLWSFHKADVPFQCAQWIEGTEEGDAGDASTQILGTAIICQSRVNLYINMRDTKQIPNLQKATSSACRPGVLSIAPSMGFPIPPPPPLCDAVGNNKTTVPQTMKQAPHWPDSPVPKRYAS